MKNNIGTVGVVTGAGVKRTMRTALQSCTNSVGPAINPESPVFLRRMAALVPGIINVFNHKTQSNEYTNRSLGPMLGYTSQEIVDMGDTVISRIIHPDDIEALVAYFQSIGKLEDGEISTFDYRDLSKDGSVVWVRSIDTVFERDTDGSVLRHLGIVFDITAQKEAEERLIAINQELEELTYVATHDLKVPINNMISLTHMLKQASDEMSADNAETLDWMQSVCEQASDKLGGLVSVAQAKSAEIPTFEAVDLAAVTERVLVNLHFRVSEARAIVRAHFDVPTVEFAPREIENIIEVTLTNALAYRDPDRRCRIDIGSRMRADCVEIYIKDNGTGLNLPEDAEKVFGLFKRAHSTPEGAGVALYAIRSLLERIGGEISVKSNEDAGVCFVLVFPRVRQLSGADDEAA